MSNSRRPGGNVVHIALVGMAGSGKSAVARRLSSLFGQPSADIDALVVAESGSTISTLFDTIGETGFRDLETRELVECLAADHPLIIATGGGVVERTANLDALERGARVIWLDVPVDTLATRLRASSVRRPLLEGDLDNNLRNLAASRCAKYEAVADARVVVEPDDSVSDVAQRTADLIRQRGWLQ